MEAVLASPGEDRKGTEGARIAAGQTAAGRYLRVVDVPDPEPESVFVITAYSVEGKALEAYKQRLDGQPRYVRSIQRYEDKLQQLREND